MTEAGSSKRDGSQFSQRPSPPILPYLEIADIIDTLLDIGRLVNINIREHTTG